MADNDQSLYNLRYNQVEMRLEGFGGGTPQWTPLSSGGGGTPGGNTTDVQFNDANTFGGSDNFTYDSSTSSIFIATDDTLTGPVTGGSVTISSGDSPDDSATGGLLTLTSGQALNGVSDNTGGSILMTTGPGPVGLKGGSFTMTTGDCRNPRGGTFRLTTGDSLNNSGQITGGQIILTTGTKVGGGGNDGGVQGPSVTLTTGDASQGIGPFSVAAGGNIILTCGAANDPSREFPGSIELTGNTPARGGSLYLTGSDAGRGQVGVGTDSPDASASIDVVSTTRGVGFPAMTSAQRGAISTPKAGLVVYDTDLGKLVVYTTQWEAITSVGPV